MGNLSFSIPIMNALTQIQKIEPLVPRRYGWLKNGNQPGDLSKVLRCGAMTRVGGSCLSPAMKNGRCRFHGGLSTGPRTEAGKNISKMNSWRTGEHRAEVRELRAKVVKYRKVSSIYFDSLYQFFDLVLWMAEKYTI